MLVFQEKLRKVMKSRDDDLMLHVVRRVGQAQPATNTNQAIGIDERVEQTKTGFARYHLFFLQALQFFGKSFSLNKLQEGCFGVLKLGNRQNATGNPLLLHTATVVVEAKAESNCTK